MEKDNNRDMDKLFAHVLGAFDGLVQANLLKDQQVEPRVNPALYKFNDEDIAFFKELGVTV